MRFWIFAVVTVRIFVFYDVTPCSLVGAYRRYKGSYSCTLIMEAAGFPHTSVDRTHLQTTMIIFTLMVDAVGCSETSDLLLWLMQQVPLKHRHLYITTRCHKLEDCNLRCNII